MFKDQTLSSDQLYRGIYKQFNLKANKFPTLYAIRNKRRLLDQGVKINKNEFGVYVEAKTKIFYTKWLNLKVGKKPF